jgi:hypothetical protein
MATNMLAPRKAATILIGVAIGAAATASGGVGAALAQPQPDLTVSMNAVPNPAPIGMGYEVQVIVSNPQPSPRVIGPAVPRVPVAPPGVPVPDVTPPRPASPEGADVQEAELLLGSTVPGGRIAMQTTPPLSISGCHALGPGSPNERCIIGPLNKGGSWTITLVYSSPVPPGQTFPYTIGYWATIDDRNKIAERNEGNNTATVTVSFQCVPTTRCVQDPATTNPSCQICSKDHCDGTGSLWHTC